MTRAEHRLLIYHLITWDLSKVEQNLETCDLAQSRQSSNQETETKEWKRLGGVSLGRGRDILRSPCAHSYPLSAGILGTFWLLAVFSSLFHCFRSFLSLEAPASLAQSSRKACLDLSSPPASSLQSPLSSHHVTLHLSIYLS